MLQQASVCALQPYLEFRTEPSPHPLTHKIPCALSHFFLPRLAEVAEKALELGVVEAILHAMESPNAQRWQMVACLVSIAANGSRFSALASSLC